MSIHSLVKKVNDIMYLYSALILGP